MWSLRLGVITNQEYNRVKIIVSSIYRMCTVETNWAIGIKYTKENDIIECLM